MSFFNSLLNKYSFDLSKFNTFAEKKINVLQELKSIFGRVEIFVRKGENADFLFLYVLKIHVSESCLKSRIVQ